MPAHRCHVRVFGHSRLPASQSRFPRMLRVSSQHTLTRHYKEPVMAATSSFTEGASVFGGQSNLLQAINNIFTIYNPDVIAVHTTCLSETIGDDVPQIIAKAKADGKIPEGKTVFHTNTPAYVGSHVTGFANMTKAMVDYFAKQNGRKEECINIIPGWVEPSDMKEIKRIAAELGIRIIMFPDTDNVLNGPQTGKFTIYPKGGVTLDALEKTGSSQGTIGLGPLTSGPAALALDAKCKVPCEILDLPIGVQATDRFVDALRKMAGLNVPESINIERGQLIDVITDNQAYFHGKKAALVGDPDQLVSLTEFLVSIDMMPIHIVTGTKDKNFEKRIETLTEDIPHKVNVKSGGDMYLLHQWMKNDPVDLIFGNSYTKFIARDEDIPCIRFGFPITERVATAIFRPSATRAGCVFY